MERALRPAAVDPDLIEDAIGRNESVRLDQQQSEQRPLFRGSEVEVVSVALSDQRTQRPELHFHHPAHHHLTSRRVRPRSGRLGVEGHDRWTDASLEVGEPSVVRHVEPWR